VLLGGAWSDAVDRVGDLDGERGRPSEVAIDDGRD